MGTKISEFIDPSNTKMSLINLETVELVIFLWGQIELKSSFVFPPERQLFDLNKYSSMHLTTHSLGSFSCAWNFTIGEDFPLFQPLYSWLYLKTYWLFNWPIFSMFNGVLQLPLIQLPMLSTLPISK